MSELRKGYTTGACAAAAAKAATEALLSGKPATAITISLPNKKKATFTIYNCAIYEKKSECAVIKDAGDDPDVTNGIEIVARCERRVQKSEESIVVKGGEGVGKVTKEGLPVKAGMSAINPVPLTMIKESVCDVLKKYRVEEKGDFFTITIIVPQGRLKAKKTLNERLGIVGGISILGTTGIVEPMSLAAYREVITTCINIAVAAKVDEVVFTPGRTSQKAAESYFPFIQDAFIQTGDHVGHSLQCAVQKGITRISIVGQLGKLSKIAHGCFDTHAYTSSIDFPEVAQWAKDLGYSEKDVAYILNSNTMAQVVDYMREHTDGLFFQAVCKRVCDSVCRIVGTGVRLRSVLVSCNGDVLADSSRTE